MRTKPLPRNAAAVPQGRDASPLAEWAELENGCICCSAKNDMVRALEALMQQRSRFDYVLIETTGLANPGPVAAALWTDEQLESRWGGGKAGGVGVGACAGGRLRWGGGRGAGRRLLADGSGGLGGLRKLQLLLL